MLSRGAPWLALALLRRLAPRDRADDLLGDLEEAHGRHCEHHGALTAKLVTTLEALDVAAALMRERLLGWSRGTRMSLLDFKLGLRMLPKYPAITLVGGFAIALAIAIGALAFEFAHQLINPTLPLEAGDRMVAIRLWHARSGELQARALHDFMRWRGNLASVEHLGAYRNVGRNLVTDDGRALSTRVAEITASAFPLTRVRPLLGRPLLASDERRGAPAVVVIGERVWHTLFSADPNVIGQTVRLGKGQSTVVGVMPEAFGFPVHHRIWAPLQVEALAAEPAQGTPISIFARLAPGVSLEQAQAELDLLGQRAAAEFPATHEHLRPQVIPYAGSYFSLSWDVVRGVAYSSQALVVLFLALICANVATLVFARTATRESEIVVRTALGASRGRIVTQLLAETLVLGAFGAVVGLSVAGLGVRAAISTFESVARPLPFWLNGGLSTSTVLYAVALTILAAVIAGVLPALKVTRGLAERLRQAAVGGVDLKFGRLWTTLIVTQVALTVIFMALTLDVQRDAARVRAMEVGFPAEQYLSVMLEMDRETASSDGEVPYTEAELAHFRDAFHELEQRVTTDPAVHSVTYAMQLPGTYHSRDRIEAQGVSRLPVTGVGHVVLVASVAVNFFESLGARLVAGRGFRPGDAESSQRVVVVNESFVQQVFGGGSPIGRRVRYLCQAQNCPDPAGSGQDDWYEIVGVIRDLAMSDNPDHMGRGLGGLYHPFTPGGFYAARMAVHVRGDPAEFASRFRVLASAADPSLRIRELLPLDQLHRANWRNYDFFFRLAFLVSAVVLLLAVSGIYSIMSFTVSRRTREIGIRTALGADPHRVILEILSRALLHVGLGVLAGAVILVVMMRSITSGGGAVLVLVPTALMMFVSLLACLAPTRRALRIQPTDALREG